MNITTLMLFQQFHERGSSVHKWAKSIHSIHKSLKEHNRCFQWGSYNSEDRIQELVMFITIHQASYFSSYSPEALWFFLQYHGSINIIHQLLSHKRLRQKWINNNNSIHELRYIHEVRNIDTKANASCLVTNITACHFNAVNKFISMYYHI